MALKNQTRNGMDVFRNAPYTHPVIAHSPLGLLATDLDETLAVNGIIANSALDAARRIKASGISILVVTGRNYRSLLHVHRLWEVADAVIFSSGAGLWEDKADLPQECGRMGAPDVLKIRQILAQAGEDYCILDPIPDTHCFRYRRHRPAADNPDFDTRMALYRQWARRDSHEPGDATQILMIRPANLEIPHSLLNRLSAWSVFRSTSPLDHRSTWLEIFPAGLNKGTALKSYCRRKAIPRQRVLALGNDHNDESMLAWAGYGCTVEGAPEELAHHYKVLPPANRGGFTAAAEEALKMFTNGHPNA
ncbi:MAG: hypothetical protein B6D68_00025 [spirochete symbiont of Stewartia floridana]|nr:MAG: hypothetical protein B6D68_00025 [spirochete symbiont of Stewartia floridana]